jgi:RNA polymerase sigma factor (sigma-70 family)
MTTSHALERESALLTALHENQRVAAAEMLAASFERMVSAEYGYVARLVGRLLGWRSDVDDLVQEVFVSALAAWPGFRRDCTERTWLTRIALNKCRGFQRRQWLRSRLFAAWQAARESISSQASHEDDRHELPDQVRGAILQLKQHDREVIVLHYLEQMTISEIASTLGISHNAVEVRLTRARQRLKSILADDAENDN